MTIKRTKTHRGFKIGEFEDCYGNKCSIQESSLATKNCIWLGIDDAKPQVMAREHPELANGETTGWVPYPIPDDVLLQTRMHLTQKQAKELAKSLLYFVKYGWLPKTAKDANHHFKMLTAWRPKVTVDKEEKPV